MDELLLAPFTWLVHSIKHSVHNFMSFSFLISGSNMLLISMLGLLIRCPGDILCADSFKYLS